MEAQAGKQNAQIGETVTATHPIPAASSVLARSGFITPCILTKLVLMELDDALGHNPETGPSPRFVDERRWCGCGEGVIQLRIALTGFPFYCEVHEACAYIRPFVREISKLFLGQVGLCTFPPEYTSRETMASVCTDLQGQLSAGVFRYEDSPDPILAIDYKLTHMAELQA